jgi:S1-C subfamily serine protease
MNATISITVLSALLGQPAAVNAKALPPKVEAELVAATVRVINKKKDAIGNGVVIDATAAGAYVLTAGHVVSKSNQMEVRVYGSGPDAKPLIYADVTVLKERTQDNQDLALLLIKGYRGESSGLKICPKDGVPKGKPFDAFAAACREGKSASVRSETIEKSERVAKPKMLTPALFWCSGRRALGSESGGPLVNARGELLGICSGADGEHGYFCHLDEIHDFVRSEGLGFLLEKKKTP